jgi:hypothetical protein
LYCAAARLRHAAFHSICRPSFPFLELLPGLRDRDGLPVSIRFWKKRVEESDPDNTFTVGLVYGPSGCGNSSLVKAGLLPRLSGRVNARDG